MKLSIAIPTYNRADTLPYLLDSILGQIDKSKYDELEILVSDNASTDSTSAIVADYSVRYPGLFSYFKNSQNFGYSKNVDLSVRRSKGTFVLLMSDDDALEDNTLRPLLNSIEKHASSASLFFSNVVPYGADMTNPRSASVNGEVRERRFDSGIDFIRATKSFPPALLSGYVVNRQDWLDFGLVDKHVESIIVHMLVALDVCLCGNGVVMTGLNLVKYRQCNSNTTAIWGLSPLYPFKFYLDCLQGLKDVGQDKMPRDVYRMLYAAAARTIVFYLARQKIVAHPFDRDNFWACFGRVKMLLSVYTAMAYVIRFMPGCLLRPFFGRLVARYPI